MCGYGFFFLWFEIYLLLDAIFSYAISKTLPSDLYCDFKYHLDGDRLGDLLRWVVHS